MQAMAKFPRVFKKVFRSEKWLELVIPLKLTTLKLKCYANRCETVEDCVNLAFDSPRVVAFPFMSTSIRPGQVKEEIIELLKILAKLRPRFTFEIGTASGGTLFLFSRVAAPDATLISVDLPGGPFGGGYSEVKTKYYASFAMRHQKIHLLRMNSHNEATLREVNKILDGHKVDFLFIDGDHTYNGAKTDFEMYGTLVGKGGIIAFHDVCPPSPKNRSIEVNKLWNEIKNRYEHIEIVEDWKQGSAGIGVIFV